MHEIGLSTLPCWSTKNVQNSSQTGLKKFTQGVYKSNLFLLIKLEFYLQIANIHTPYSTAHQFIHWKRLGVTMIGRRNKLLLMHQFLLETMTDLGAAILVSVG